MAIGKKQQIMVDWFRKTLDESKKPWNTQVYLITDKLISIMFTLPTRISD